MKKIIYLINITFLLLQACSSNNNSNNNNTDNNSSNNNVNYSFTVINDGVTYKVQGNTINDFGFKGPVNNKCTASIPTQVSLKITDPTYSNYVCGNPMNLLLVSANPFTLGTNYMDTNWNLYHQYANPGASGANTTIPITITDLGTPSVGVLGTSNYRFGNTIKGYYTGTYYSIPSGSNVATVPHNISIEFEAVRLY
jgi:hypothetical protein